MANALPDAAYLFKGLESRLKPCDKCGERGQILREQFAWGSETSYRIACKNRHQITWENPPPARVDGNTARYFEAVAKGIAALVDEWNIPAPTVDEYMKRWKA